MARAFATLAFTSSVKAAQAQYGSAAVAASYERAVDTNAMLGEEEAQFIDERDSFYQASVSESGWPYMQHRGGPAGFLRVLDAHTLAYADFRGNLQYLSVGNLAANDRIHLFLIDYANRRRLKIWGRARVIDARDDSPLLAKLAPSTYGAKVERAIVITVEAFDWNCPQHITQRYTLAQVEDMAARLLDENRQLKAALAAKPA